MLVYVADLGKTEKIYLYSPVNNEDFTREFFDSFKEMPFKEITQEERKMYKTKAFYKTDAETFSHWQNLVSEVQDVSDKFHAIGKLHMLKILGHQVWIKTDQPVKKMYKRHKV